jgi:peptidyl-prolyl cis-trans isomerase A (cyclophilin A)
MKPRIISCMLFGLMLSVAGQAVAEAQKSPAQQSVMVEMKTSLGEVTLLLDTRKAPISVKNFLRYVDEGFYDGTIFHRVIPGFMVQGGGFDAAMKKLEVHEPIKNEAANGLQNLRGTIALARTNAVDSATSQFFINTVDNAFLDHNPPKFGYAVFGKVIQGISVIQAIEAEPTSTRGRLANVPTEPITIISIKLLN